MNYSWKTSVSGVVAILVGLGMLGKIIGDFIGGEPVSYEQFAIAIGVISSGVAGILARDNDKTSEEVGAK